MTAALYRLDDMAVLQRQLLVETAEQVMLDRRDDLVAVLRDNLGCQLGPTSLELHAVLLAAAWRDADHLSGYLSAVHDRQVAVEQHDDTTGHDFCCQDECDCAPRRPWSQRCDDCSVRPHALLDDAVRDLQHFLEHTVSARAVRECAGAVA